MLNINIYIQETKIKLFIIYIFSYFKKIKKFYILDLFL